MKYGYYMGRHKVKILESHGKKALIMHYDWGYVGNQREGYKDVEPGDKDLVPIRLIWREKKK